MKNKIPTNHDEMIIHCSTFKELLDIENGNPGTPEQEQFNTDAAAFCVTETLKKILSILVLLLMYRNSHNITKTIFRGIALL